MAPESESHRRVQGYLSETLAATIAELSSPDGRPSITFRRRYQKATFFINPNTRALEAAETTSQITYTWPGKDAHEAWKYSQSVHTEPLAVMITISSCVHEGLSCYCKSSPFGYNSIEKVRRKPYLSHPTCWFLIFNRDIYYSDPACFGTQKVVDAIVDDFAHTIGVDRAALNVVHLSPILLFWFCDMALLIKVGIE